LWPTEGWSREQQAGQFVLQGTLWQSAVKNVADTDEVAVLVAHCDEDAYGRLRMFRFQQRHSGRASTRAGLPEVELEAKANTNNGRNELNAVSPSILVPIGALDAGAKSEQVAQRLLGVVAQSAPEAGVPQLRRVIVSNALDASQPSGSGTNLEQAWRKFWGEDVPARPRTVNELARQALSTHEKVQSAASDGRLGRLRCATQKAARHIAGIAGSFPAP
jgi:hypothetical protein